MIIYFSTSYFYNFPLVVFFARQMTLTTVCITLIFCPKKLLFDDFDFRTNFSFFLLPGFRFVDRSIDFKLVNLAFF